MNDHEVIQHMITFIEKQEKEQQANFVLTGNKAKTDIVNKIIKELEKVFTNENKEN